MLRNVPVLLTITPWGSVYHRGAKVGEGTVVRVILPSRVVSLTIVHPSLGTHNVVLDLSAGERLSRRLDLRGAARKRRSR